MSGGLGTFEDYVNRQYLFKLYSENFLPASSPLARPVCLSPIHSGVLDLQGQERRHVLNLESLAAYHLGNNKILGHFITRAPILDETGHLQLYCVPHKHYWDFQLNYFKDISKHQELISFLRGCFSHLPHSPEVALKKRRFNYLIGNSVLNSSQELALQKKLIKIANQYFEEFSKNPALFLSPQQRKAFFVFKAPPFSDLRELKILFFFSGLMSVFVLTMTVFVSLWLRRPSLFHADVLSQAKLFELEGCSSNRTFASNSAAILNTSITRWPLVNTLSKDSYWPFVAPMSMAFQFFSSITMKLFARLNTIQNKLYQSGLIFLGPVLQLLSLYSFFMYETVPMETASALGWISSCGPGALKMHYMKEVSENITKAVLLSGAILIANTGAFVWRVRDLNQQKVTIHDFLRSFGKTGLASSI